MVAGQYCLTVTVSHHLVYALDFPKDLLRPHPECMRLKCRGTGARSECGSSAQKHCFTVSLHLVYALDYPKDLIHPHPVQGTHYLVYALEFPVPDGLWSRYDA